MSLPLRMLKKSRKAVQRRPCAWEGPQPPKVLIGLSLSRDLLWNSLLMVPDSIVSLFYLLLWQQFVHSWVLDWWAQSWSCCPYAPSQEQVHSESDSPGAIYLGNRFINPKSYQYCLPLFCFPPMDQESHFSPPQGSGSSSFLPYPRQLCQLTITF